MGKSSAVPNVVDLEAFRQQRKSRMQASGSTMPMGMPGNALYMPVWVWVPVWTPLYT